MWRFCGQCVRPSHSPWTPSVVPVRRIVAAGRPQTSSRRTLLHLPSALRLPPLGTTSRVPRRLAAFPPPSAEGPASSSSPDSPSVAPRDPAASAQASDPSPSTTTTTSSSSRQRSTPPKTPPPSWLAKLAARLKPHQPLRFLFNVAALLLLMRLWPLPGSRLPLTNADGSSLVVSVAYSEFVKQVRRNEVSKVVVDGPTFTYTLRPNAEWVKNLPGTFDRQRLTLTTLRATDFPPPYEQLLKNGVAFSALDKKNGLLGSIVVYAVGFLLVLAALNRLPMKLQPRGPARRLAPGQPSAGDITFADVAGVDEAKEELAEIVDYLREPEKFSRLGARPPTGVLLIGPPGTGKTLLAKAVAGEADVPFFSISASEFVELYVGMGALRVRDLFAQARAQAPSIVFIDEIDAVAKGRSSRLSSVGNDEREQTLNQLLTELDGFDTSATNLVICIAATNRADVLDTALLRPGRFDRRILVERPDRQGRKEILGVHLARRELPLAADVNLDALAAQTTGLTGADLANLVNEAALLAGRGGKTEVAAEDFDSAVLRAVAGIEKKRSMLKGVEKSTVARHEVGHALVASAVAAVVPSTNSVERLSIIPRSGGALGFTYSPSSTEDRSLLFEPEIRGQLAMLMGGRAAEELTCEAVSTGAVDDIRRATDLATKAVSEYGLSADVGPLNVGALAASSEEYAVLRDSGGDTGRAVEREVRALCGKALAAAKDVVAANRQLHAALSAQLEASERLDGPELRDALAGTQVPEALRVFVLGRGV